MKDEVAAGNFSSGQRWVMPDQSNYVPLSPRFGGTRNVLLPNFWWCTALAGDQRFSRVILRNNLQKKMWGTKARACSSARENPLVPGVPMRFIYRKVVSHVLAPGAVAGVQSPGAMWERMRRKEMHGRRSCDLFPFLIFCWPSHYPEFHHHSDCIAGIC